MTKIQPFALIFVNFLLITFLWIFFRSDSITSAFGYIHNIIYSDKLVNPFIIPELKYATLTMILVVFFVIVEWSSKDNEFAIEKIFSNSLKPIKVIFFGFILFLIGMYSSIESSPFIYFQF